MYTSGHQDLTSDPSTVVVDLRSDVMTRPTPAMRERMANASVGDDVIQEDPTVKALEHKIAEMLGKEAGLYVTSGSMGNLLASLVHCQGRGTEAILGDKTHMFYYEQGTLAQFAGVQANIVPIENDGTFSLQGIRDRIRDHSNDHYPKTSLIAVENTCNYTGGSVLPLEWIDEVNKIGREHGIPTHLDGARLFNASVASGVAPQRIVQGFSSVSICLSKGLGAPVGSLLVGEKHFIQQARRLRKALGGGMRQAGIIAAAGLYCLENMIDRLADDHKNAKTIASAVSALNSPTIKCNLAQVQTNMVLLNVNKRISAESVCARFAQVTEAEKTQLGGDSIQVLAWPRTENIIRLVLHSDISDEMTAKAANKICLVAQELESTLTGSESEPDE